MYHDSNRQIIPEQRIEQELRRELAIALYTQDILSFGKARELAEMDKYEFGQLLSITLAVRVHSCSCGLVMDRDWNSALNLLKHKSVGLPISGCGGLDISQSVKQQVSFVNPRCSRYIACN